LRRIVHRDIKTANIFLNKNKEIKIGDFGISKSLDQSVMAATAMIGTPYYLSPEMVEGKPYSTKADIWALGVLLYALLCGRFPFKG
jgi:NIMA (never in mitosis gene a)-related kinase